MLHKLISIILTLHYANEGTDLSSTVDGSDSSVSILGEQLRAKGNLSERGDVTGLYGHRIAERD